MNFEGMTPSVKAIPDAYLFLEVFELFRIKFEDTATAVAYHMVVMSMSEGMLIDIAFFRSCDLFYQPALNKEVQGPVNRCTRGLGA